MMIGSPGTGKSMLAKAMAELLPKEELQDILVYPNSDDKNNPIIRTVAAGRGKQIVAAHKAEAKKKIQFRNTLLMLLLLGIAGYAIITMQLLMGIIAGAFVFMALRYNPPGRGDGAQAAGLQRYQEHRTVYRRDRVARRSAARGCPARPVPERRS